MKYMSESAPGKTASGDRAHACCATAVLGPLARETANHRRENYLQTQHSTRPALEPSPVEATSLETQPASLRCALPLASPHFRSRRWPSRRPLSQLVPPSPSSRSPVRGFV